MRPHNKYSTKDHFGSVEQGENIYAKKLSHSLQGTQEKHAMRFKNFSVLAVALVVLSALSFSVIPTTLAETSSVTVRWTVAAEYGITVSLPANTDNILFEPAGQNFTETAATGQTPSVAAMNITNTGNASIKIMANFSADLPTGVTYVNISVADNTNASGKYWFVPANDTTPQEIEDSIVIGSSQLFWFWTSGVEVAAGTTDKTFTVTSSAA